MVSPGVEASTKPGASKPPDRFARRLTIGFCLVALVLGAFEAWTSRFEMNPDGIQYLDNAALYLQGDFRNALNAQWSPLYPWLIAGAAAIAHPPRERMFELAHAVNFGVFLLSIGCFLFVLESMPRPAPANFLLLGYAAFLYCSLDFTHLRYVTPDLLVSCFAFAIAGLLVRMANGGAALGGELAIGLLLGLGYLAKAPFLPIAIFCLGVMFAVKRRRALVPCAVFLCVTAPYVAAISQSKHRFTLGDSAKLNLAWHVDGLPNTNWQGGPAGNGQPSHPTRQLSVHPAIFEFDGPAAGTYPPWYDPSYWNDGVRVSYRAPRVMHAVWEQLRLYSYLLHHRQLALVFALSALLLISTDKAQILTRLKSVWPALAVALVAFAMYAPVHAEGRYLAPFFVLFWSAAFACFPERNRATIAISATAALLMLMESTAVAAIQPSEAHARLHFQAARDLRSLGLKPGERVAMVSGDLPYYWAYLSGALIAIQISFTADDYRTREDEWRAARQILASQTATCVVSPAVDGVTNQPGWIPIGTVPGAKPAAFAYPIHPHSAY